MSRSPHTATLIAALLIVAGFVMIVLGWKGGAATLFVPTQLAFSISGGMIGIGLVGTGLGVLMVQGTRLATARRSQDLQQLVGDTVELFVAVRAHTAQGTRPLQVPIPRPTAEPGAVPETVAAANGHVPVDDHAPFRPDVMLVPGAKTFHRADCRIVAAAPAALHLSVEEAAAAGLRPCRICGPVAEAPAS